jgi:hypothetical protein
MWSPDRWRDWAYGGHRARAPAARQASCQATPAAAAVGPAHALAGALPDEGCPEAPPGAARSVVPASVGVFPAVLSASHRNLMVLADIRLRAGYRRSLVAGAVVTHVRLRTFNSGVDNGSEGVRFPRHALMEPAGTCYAGVWQTASMLWPSGSSMIDRADPGRAIVASAGSDRGLVESVHGGAVLRQNRDVQRLVQAAFAADPEIRLSIGAETGGRLLAGSLLLDLHHEMIVERRQCLQIERLRAFIIRNRKPDVVDHQTLLRFEG